MALGAEAFLANGQTSEEAMTIVLLDQVGRK